MWDNMPCKGPSDGHAIIRQDCRRRRKSTGRRSPVMAIFDQDTLFESMKDDSDEENLDTKWEVTIEVCSYLLSVLALT